MEHLILDLKESLLIRKQNEVKIMDDFNKEEDRDLLLITTGKIIELEYLLKCLENMIMYIEKTKKIQK